MNWAMEQATGCPWTQCLLYVVADAANPDGICWPSADWMAEKSQQSRATVYRRLGELRDMGLLALFPRFIDDEGKVHYEGASGRRQTSPEIRLIFSIKVDLPRKRVRRNPDENDDDGEGGVSLSATGESPLSDSPPVAAERQPPSHCSDSEKNRNLNQEDSPQPPKGGGQAINEELEDDITEFGRNYPAPITNMPRLRTVLAAIPRPQRRRIVTTAAKGYASYIRECDQKKKPRAVKDADRWVASGMWEGYVAAGERSEAAARKTHVEVDSQAGKAWAVLHRIAHVHPFETAGFYLLPDAPSARLLALASPPPEQDWAFITPDQINQCGAWDEFVRECLHGKSRPPLITERNPGGRRGFYAPWAWPPRVDGSLTSTGPPDHKLSEEDIEALSNWK